MLIGIDFDNTIVSYDTLFHKVATEQGAVPGSTPQTKLAVRDHLRAIGKEDVWTEMQGYVYGARMAEAEAYPGVIEFFRWTRARSVPVCIVSHKTLHPFIGPRHDLHRAARGWIETHLVDDEAALVAPDRVFFELTKEAKWGRIAAAGCDWFIDDLPEILLADAFPGDIERILFDPDAHHADAGGLLRFTGWNDIRRHFERQCSPKN
jgi:FMN phosphatase YigB (HAD superfamily)